MTYKNKSLITDYFLVNKKCFEQDKRYESKKESRNRK